MSIFRLRRVVVEDMLRFVGVEDRLDRREEVIRPEYCRGIGKVEGIRARSDTKVISMSTLPDDYSGARSEQRTV